MSVRICITEKTCKLENSLTCPFLYPFYQN
nr:MAG TPA: hypothetical protein [Caudoviricetes sp.]